MKLINVDVLKIRYRRPGLSKIDFLAQYEGYLRRGTLVYDTVDQKFITHTKDIVLLSEICTSLQRPKYHKNS